MDGMSITSVSHPYNEEDGNQKKKGKKPILTKPDRPRFPETVLQLGLP